MIFFKLFRSEELQNNVEEVKNPAEINLEDSDEDDESKKTFYKFQLLNILFQF